MINSKIKNIYKKLHFIVAILLFCWVFLPFPLSTHSQVFSEERINPAKKAADKLSSGVEYSATDFRDPFQPQIFISEEKEVKVTEPIKMAKPRASDLFSLSIQGVIWKSENPLVIINNEVLKKGETLSVSKEQGVEKIGIVDIEKDGVTITYSGEIEKLTYSGAPEKEGRDDKR
jgi:type II secretory pathway component PulC